ncbi:hypothetical protein [Methylobacterium komagatae]
MNIDNLNKLIAHLEAQPPERINMGWVDVIHRDGCGTCGCISGHAMMLWPETILASQDIGLILDIGCSDVEHLTMPRGWMGEVSGDLRYPAHRVIATLKRLRDTYLSTGQVVVDWGPEPGEESKQAWTAPQVAEVIAPALPAELTSLLRTNVEA